MSIIVHYKPKMSTAQYEESIKKLEAAGAGRFVGRTHHFSYEVGENVYVTDVYDSMESFQEFGAILVPILQDIGVEMTQEPDINTVYNSIV